MAPTAANAPGLVSPFSVEAWFGWSPAGSVTAASADPLTGRTDWPVSSVQEPALDQASAGPDASLPTLHSPSAPGAVGGGMGGQPSRAAGLAELTTESLPPRTGSGSPVASGDWVVPLGVADGGPLAVPGASSTPAARTTGGRLMVQWRSDATEEERNVALTRLGASRHELIHTLPMKARGEGVLEVIDLPASTSVEEGMAAYGALARVSYAEVDQRVTPGAWSNDPGYVNGYLWGMYGSDTPTVVGPAGTTNAYGSNAEAAWNLGLTGSSSVVVGVVDEGFDFNHPDLAANSWLNPFEPLDGIDNDGNGYIDDVRGWDFSGKDNSVFDGPSDDHGTHVAGIIGAVGGNGIGVTGVNWSVSMISAKFLGAGGGYVSDAIQALDYLTDLKQRHGINIVASNNSWGGSSYSQGLHEAIIRAAKQNILFVTAAGNGANNNDANEYYPANYTSAIGTGGLAPASYDAVVSVASITSTGELSNFSSYGSTTVDLAAPGSSIVSTLPGGVYGSYSGTSMATPHVTGAIALYAASNPGRTAEEIRTALLASTTPTPSLAGKTVSGGRLNVEAFLKATNAPAVSLSVSPDKVQEDGETNLVYTFTRTGASSNPLTVTYNVTGTATPGVDYSGIPALPANRSVTFAAGAATATLKVDPTADGELEPDETVALTLLEAAGYTLATTNAVVGTILNDENQVIEAFGGTKLVKDASNRLFAQVGANPPVAIKYQGAQTTQGMFSGWEVLAAETVAGVNQVMWKNIAENYLHLWTMDSHWAWVSSTGTWGLNSLEALQQETNFQQDFNGNGTIGAGVVISLAVAPARVLETGTANLVYTFARTGSTSNPLTVNYSVSGTATLGVDYSGIPALPASKSITFAAGAATATLTVDPTPDGELEPDETVALTLLEGAGYTPAATGPVVGTIQNDANQVLEACGGTKLLKDGANRLSAQVGDNPPVAIKYQGAQITQGMFSGWETLAAETVAGVNQVIWKNIPGNYLHLWTMDSNWAWLSSTGAWGLRSGEALQQEINFQQDFNGNGVIGGAGSFVSLSVAPDKVLEDGPSNLVYTFTRTGSTSTPLTVNYAVNGTATPGLDYSGIPALPANKTITFAAGAATALLTVDPTADGDVEPDETVALTLLEGAGYTLGTAGAVVGTIQSDESQVLEACGGTKLLKDGASRLSAQVGDNPPVAIKYQGAQISQGMFKGWETLGAETVAGVNQVVWKYIPGNYLHLWTLDNNWAWVSSTGSWGLGSAEALQLETKFQQDFNGNGVIGASTPYNLSAPTL